MTEDRLCPLTTFWSATAIQGLQGVTPQQQIQTHWAACQKEKCQWWMPGIENCVVHFMFPAQEEFVPPTDPQEYICKNCDIRLFYVEDDERHWFHVCSNNHNCDAELETVAEPMINP